MDDFDHRHPKYNRLNRKHPVDMTKLELMQRSLDVNTKNLANELVGWVNSDEKQLVNQSNEAAIEAKRLEAHGRQTALEMEVMRRYMSWPMTTTALVDHDDYRSTTSSGGMIMVQGGYRMSSVASGGGFVSRSGGGGYAHGIANTIETLPEIKPSVDLDTVEELTNEMVDNYGFDVMDRSAGLSKRLLSRLGADNTGEMNSKLSSLVMLAKGLDPAEAKARRSWMKRILNLFGIAVEQAQERFRKLDVQIDTLAGELRIHSDRQAAQITTLESLFKENNDCYNDVQGLIVKGRMFLGKPRPPQPTDADGMVLQAYLDQSDMRERLEKRVLDLDVARTLMLQNAPEIRFMQKNARGLIDKFTTIRQFTIPAWQKQLVLHNAQTEQQDSANVADAIDDATNDAFSKNADRLRETTTQIAKAGYRPMLDASTIQHINKQIMGVVEDLTNAQAVAHSTRVSMEATLAASRNHLIARLSGSVPTEAPQIEDRSGETADERAPIRLAVDNSGGS